MTRTEYVLAVMAAVRAPLSPVQLQKLFFILDRKAAASVGGPHFQFEPYNYGPFDPAVYTEVETLAAQGAAFINGLGGGRRYGITANGLHEGEAKLKELPAADYVRRVGEYVTSMTFAQLVSAVYTEFPEMKAKSIFRDPEA